MAHHTHKLANTTLEEDTCELLCLYSLFISDNTECFYLDIEEISFPLAPHIMESEHELELQSESSTNNGTNLSKAKSNWKYNPVKGINLSHYHDRIYVPKTIFKRVLRWYHCYLQHTGGGRLVQTLTTVCVCSGIVYQARKLCKTCKYCQNF